MTNARRLVIIGLFFAIQAEARAQFIPPPPGFGVGPGVGFRVQRRHVAVIGSTGGPSFGYPFFGPVGYGFPTTSVTSVTIISTPPPVVSLPPIIINNNVVVNPDGGRDDRRAERDPLEDDRFLRIVPRKQAAPKPAERVRPEPPPPAPKKAEKPADMPAPRKPAPDKLADNPKDENARLINLGQEAFAAGEYGRAERRFEQAVRAEPREPATYFLLSQAQFALGKFQEAVESIEAGMRRKADGPGERFRPRLLYAGNDDDFNNHMARLADTLERNPNDFFLLFLRGHQLWFNGEQAEARKLFERAVKLAPEPMKPLVNRFLMHGQPVAQRP
jgi:cytochrome c-type biogenesis protein CcmH/NrfG